MKVCYKGGKAVIYRIGICDDEKFEKSEIADKTGDFFLKSGLEASVKKYSSAEELYFARKSGEVFDILLLDVEMSGMTGIDLAKKLRKEGYRGEIIFITSHFELAGEGYEVDALHYLVKPVSYEKLSAVLKKATERLSAEPPFIVIEEGGERLKLYESEIVYVEAFLHYVEIHTISETLRIKESISELENKLSADFFRAHRSYIVSLKAVARIGRNGVTLSNGVELPLSRGKYDEINRAFIERN